MNNQDIDILHVRTSREIHDAIRELFARIRQDLPRHQDAFFLIKPNLNSNMNALTGNTTDLRILSAVISALKGLGYANITIGEGTNSGYYRKGINVISRLRISHLAWYHGIQIKDLNYDNPVDIDFEDGQKAGVARTCFEADYFINIPKLKTHYETEMSVCLKSLMGCLVGMDNKKKTHSSLINNIYNINKALSADLHIVDAVIAMEGNGPTTGTPVKLGMILAGKNPILLDLACASVAGIPYKEVPLLKLAEERGDFGEQELRRVREVTENLDNARLLRPKISFLTALVTNKRLQKYFLMIRHAPLIRTIFNSRAGNRLLFALKLTQEIFDQEEARVDSLSLVEEDCSSSGICDAYCPMQLDLPAEVGKEDVCINCLYCYAVCPNNAIHVTGELGFFSEQIEQYDNRIRSMNL